MRLIYPLRFPTLGSGCDNECGDYQYNCQRRNPKDPLNYAGTLFRVLFHESQLAFDFFRRELLRIHAHKRLGFAKFRTHFHENLRFSYLNFIQRTRPQLVQTRCLL